jgi:predicted ArsR family transcriptional regulator
MDLGSSAAGIGALADDTRRALYEYVTSQPEAVGRDQAAAALRLPRHTVSFHLDRLAAEGLLQVDYQRLGGRSGPGAGRPSKLYRRSDREFSVSLPPRRYDLVGDILAAAVARAANGAVLEEALVDCAREAGSKLGVDSRGASQPGLPAVAQALRGQGYEPRLGSDVVELVNCPFDALAARHASLVCGLNECFVQGVADGLGCRGVTARLEPEPGLCCVKVRTDGPLEPTPRGSPTAG